MQIDYTKVPHGADTNQAGRDRFEIRVNNIFSKNVADIKGKRILDLACNTGRLAYPMLMLGAKEVVGVEARRSLIDRGEEIFASSPYADQMTFVESDLFDYLDAAEPGEFDVIVCAGFLYHTVRHADFFRALKRLKPSTTFLDTNVAKNYFWFGRKMFGKPPALFMSVEDASRTSDTTDLDGIVYWPSTSFLTDMLDLSGYSHERIYFEKDSSKDWSEMQDYKKGTRASFVGRLKA